MSIRRSNREEPGSIAERLEAMYAEHGAMVLAVCRCSLRDIAEAEDAAQQTFLSAQRALANGSLPQDPAAWLATIARHECMARARQRARGPLPTADETSEPAPDAHVSAVRREQFGELRDALADLPAQQREAILLREFRGLSYEEVASSLAVSTSAVESLIFRARRRLQVRLREAAAGIAPSGWLDLLREAVTRIVSGGLAAPAAAKVVAIGVGAAVVAGGTGLSPQIMGLGRFPSSAHRERAGPQDPRLRKRPAPTRPVSAPLGGSGVLAVPAAGAGETRLPEHRTVRRISLDSSTAGRGAARTRTSSPTDHPSEHEQDHNSGPTSDGESEASGGAPLKQVALPAVNATAASDSSGGDTATASASGSGGDGGEQQTAPSGAAESTGQGDGGGDSSRSGGQAGSEDGGD